ncbi:midasin MDN1 [Vairimorpha necatrix]|uniref:Midasin n=1 Tax=Vairimorpha necatrix TaxID=6039 RepID=A0AAX4JDW9_9MICR
MNEDLTHNFIKNYKDLLKDMESYKNLKIPICIYGEIGKTRFLKSIIKNLIIIDSREISDIRNLSGFYAIENGEINYVEGILITALKKGLNILFKNIDQNYNLQFFLNSVIKNRKIVNNKNEEIFAEKNFNIFFTSKEKFKNNDIYFLGPVNYTLFKYPKKLENIMENVIHLLNSNVNTKCDHNKNMDCNKFCMSGNFDCYNGSTLCLSKQTNLRIFHYKKIFQLHKLLDEKILNSHEARLEFYDKLVTLFLNHDSEELLSTLNLNYFPDVVIFDFNIVKTYAYKLAIRNILNNIKMKKYSLLIGETGVGKTSLVQYICNNSRKYFDQEINLKVVNMSPDVDGYDLIGGYGSFDIEKRITDLYNKHLISKPKIFDNKILIKDLKEKVNDEEVDFLEKCIQNKTNFIWKDGILVEAMKNGFWILLDEINLCNDETLGMIDSLLSKKEVINYERKNVEKIEIHKNFMLFACMNPGNDHGKKNFISHNFNYVTFYDFTSNIFDIKAVIANYVQNILEEKEIEKLSEIFYEIKQGIRNKELTNKIEPLISGRTLIRCLNAIKNNRNINIMDIFSVFILTQFDLQSRSVIYSKLSSLFSSIENKILPTYEDCGYILTPKTQIMMYDLKISILLNCPILLQGDTSTGKTSIIFYLANKQNRKVIRFNNHEHTEASDYLGNYIATPKGIKFKESVFIEAIRKGWWVILDELNLAQSDVLEVLNRLLDDNKEIYLNQNDELIKAHPDFRLFATQNIEYGGRKGISKAFRNRFIEIFFGEKTDLELLEILHIKTKLPKSFCTNMIKIYTKLKNLRNIDSLMTLRDLFKWANRIPKTMFEVYEIGLSIIYERQRNYLDKEKVLDIFREVFNKLEKFNFDYSENDIFRIDNELIANISKDIILTPSLLKIIKLLKAAIFCKEPILLIGETGIGKTKICEVLAKYLNRNFVFTNMHSGIESSDFTGNFTLDQGKIEWKNGPLIEAVKNGHFFLIDEINLAEDAVLERLNSLLEDKREIFVTEIDENFRAHDDFIIVATMNPGNDFGKRELSPALRNRFTEIYYDLPNEEIHKIFDMMLIKHGIQRPVFYENMIKTKSSLRNYELFCEFYKSMKQKVPGVVKIRNDISDATISKEAYQLAFTSGHKTTKDEYNSEFNLGKNDEKYFDTSDFKETEDFIILNSFCISKSCHVSFDFQNQTTLYNLNQILRALVVQKGLLLEGEPGVGKTSIIYNLSKLVNKKCIRINLSEQTELSDLVGTYLPVKNGIKFVKSQFTQALENGDWIILDEINLCSQSVIEGLNSVLDYRRKLVLSECIINVHSDTKIFATMNPYNNLNGRKILPKSFVDRFVSIYMRQYTKEDIKNILEKLFIEYKYYEKVNLRENIKRNLCPVTTGKINYKVDENKFQLGNVRIQNYNYDVIEQNKKDKSLNLHEIHRSMKLDENNISDLSKRKSKNDISDYVLIHSQLPQLEIILSALLKNIPVIITGGFGKSSLINFISNLFNLQYFDFMCHKEIDTSDLLGQYHKSDEGTFLWRNSLFIENILKGSLIVLHNPELIEKSIFDRCNSLFESDRSINIYEKGIDTEININNKTKFILLVDNLIDLSPAIIDRCYVVELSDKISYIDAWKIFYRNRQIYKNHLNDQESLKKYQESHKYDAYNYVQDQESLKYDSYLKDQESLKYDAYIKYDPYANRLCLKDNPYANDQNYEQDRVCLKDDAYVQNQESLKDNPYLKDRVCLKDESTKKMKLSGNGDSTNINFEDFKYKEFVDTKDFDISYRKFQSFSITPKFLYRNLTNIYNEILHKNIENMFRFKKKEIEFDTSKIKYIEFYKKIKFNINRGENDKEKILNMRNTHNLTDNEKCITFIKNMNLEIIYNKNEHQETKLKNPIITSTTNNNTNLSMFNIIEDNTTSTRNINTRKKNSLKDTCILNVPTNLQELKETILSSLNSKSLKDIPNLKDLCTTLSQFCLSFTTNFDPEYFTMLQSFQEDPLSYYKDYITFLKYKKENEILEDIYENIKSLYKYGRGEIRDLVSNLEEINTNFYNEILIINKKLDRDFYKFKKMFLNLDLCSYLLDIQVVELFEEFSDLLDYYLIYLLEERWKTNKCNGSCKQNDKNIIHEENDKSLIHVKNNIHVNDVSKDNLVHEEEDHVKNIIPGDEDLKNILIHVEDVFKDFVHDLYQEYQKIEVPLKSLTYKNLVATCLVNQDFIKYLKDLQYGEFGSYMCKILYSLTNKKSLDISNLVLEACLYNPIIKDTDKIDRISIPEKYINECLTDIFKIREISYILDTRVNIIHFTDKFIKTFINESEVNKYTNIDASINSNMIIGDYPLFTKQDILLDKINDYMSNNKINKNLLDGLDTSSYLKQEYKKKDQIYKELVKYYKNPDSLSWPINYKYFIFLEIHSFTKDLAERYFLDCQVYEFNDRMKFATEKSLRNNNNLMYNLVLQYKAFDIEKLTLKKINESKTKLKREPKLYSKIRKELVDFLSLPVTNILDLKFDKPGCCCKETKIEEIMYKFVDKNETNCICERFINLSEKINRSQITSILETHEILHGNNDEIKEDQNYIIHTDNIIKKNDIFTRDKILDIFYGRNVVDKFSYPEICLSKVINKITDDSSHLRLINLALNFPFPPFLYFIFNFADEDEVEYEDGTGIKGGTGEKNISDKIEEEDEISNEYCENEDIQEEDGIDLENEGNMSSVEDEEDEKNETGVDGNEESSGQSDESSEQSSEHKESNERSDEQEEQSDEGHGESSENIENGYEEELNEEESNEEELNEEKPNEKDFILEEDVQEIYNNILTDYKYKEGKLNQNQTCNEALDYERRVFGELQEEALCPGEGPQEIEGNQDQGDKNPQDQIINISYKESYSEKLVLMLRNILENNKQNKYKGDYKSGKKLNMKKLIPYIASDYRKDKIWMKRKKNDKKEYCVRLFIDNSKSMYSQEMIDTLLILSSRLKNSFKALNIPVEIYRFGETKCQCEINKMTFTDRETNVDFIEEYEEGINIILTDGIFQKTGFYNKNFLIILIDKNDIMNMSKVSVTEGNVFIQKYIELFSMKYCIIRDLEELESTFILALKELLQ